MNSCSLLDDKYSSRYWNFISKAVSQIFDTKPRTSAVKLYFEQIYSIVYKCVCDGYGEKLYNDLLRQCVEHLEEADQYLTLFECHPHQQNDVEKMQYICQFHELLEAYLASLQQIVPLFVYMNKFYVEVVMQTSLQAELLLLFLQKVSNKRMQAITSMVEDLLARPFAVRPELLFSLFNKLHYISVGVYGQQYPHLFARYVPGVLPPMKEWEIDEHIEETRELQYQLRQDLAGATAQGRGRKRRGDECYGPN
ncbi:CDK2-associated and cullin domain-containing protein 1-like [Bacillus rossius redtenbacheri]|uniref:CDK2-associated and cullin domain-containing protein 1-like n=1 Tax=Bacillus rossius redtenbacheri TaxID=93214 RepID=UPI002FDE15A5